ncbi:MAG: hypothetical protein Ct9H300mP20_17630 [Gammaproteobacteria bacterium]|nr:MAG: hypothetical protein Ct9H300mP20_17630 [Gammaproteobacteria bacterium]
MERFRSGKQFRIKGSQRYDHLAFWDFNWRKQGGSSRMIEISKREEFYQQEYWVLCKPT